MATKEGTMQSPPPFLDVDEVVRNGQAQDRQLAILKMATSSFLRRDGRLAQLREKTLLLRSRAKYAWTVCYEYLKFTDQSQTKFQEDAANFIRHVHSEGYVERVETLRSSHDQVLKDFQEQNRLAQKADELQTELSNLEYELQTREQAVKDAADSMKKVLDELVLPSQSSAATINETDVASVPSTQSSEEIPPLVDHYFSTSGKVRYALTEQFELEMEYQAARDDRDFKAEHDQSLDMSDEDFEAFWQQRREMVSAELEEAQRISASALDTCLNANFDPEDYRRRRPLGSDRSVPDTPGDDIVLPPTFDFDGIDDTGFEHTDASGNDVRNTIPILTPESRNLYPPPLEPPAPVVPPNERVLSWMEDVDESSNLYVQQNGSARRRSIQSSSPFNQLSKSQLFPSLQPPALPLKYDSVTEANERAMRHEEKFQRRRSSDSNMAAAAARLPRHDPDRQLAEELRRFAAR